MVNYFISSGVIQKKEGLRSMKKNLGTADKAVRVVVGAILIIAGIMTETWWISALSILPLASAAMGFCGLYTLLGINTCSIKEKSGN